ncbi:nucleotide exchange factor GrpE [Actinocorallia longicatena]|uniref:HSP-70 cofactor n=1 Tax=Actinocorallia longicatena TaxID=111803 RepID=A0ABP6QCB4_9ACTN
MTEGPPEIALSDVHQELIELKDLFRRRLLEDRDKKRLIDQLQDKLADQGPFREYLQPVVHQLALLIDRIDGYEGPDAEFATSVRDELLETLLGHGVQQVPTDILFHPGCHEMVAAEPSEELPHHTITLVRGRGFAHGSWVFRPARVVVSVVPG